MDAEYRTAIATNEGSMVANHMLRELMDAMGESDHARGSGRSTVRPAALRHS